MTMLTLPVHAMPAHCTPPHPQNPELRQSPSLLSVVRRSHFLHGLVPCFSLQGPRREETEGEGLSHVCVCLQLIGVFLSTLGWLSSVACCILPLWKYTTFSGQTLMIKQKMTEGLWLSCILPGPGKANCRTFSSVGKEVTLDVYIGRILTLATVTMAFLGLFVNCLGARCINCIPSRNAKSRFRTASGVIFIVSGIAQILAVTWPAYVLATEFYHPLVSEVLLVSIGPCIYIGWVAGTLLLLGGCLLGCSCCRRRRYNYPAGRGSDTPGRNFV
ncbi:claudin-4-like [Scyliorhinus torazame]|uniref:claudin-4-like n=1 Tax=Scyliorhinus torazame TaxID=75743 RepID=UPI003B5C0B76